MVKLSAPLFLLVCLPFFALGQYNLNENKTWVFPAKQGLDFNGTNTVLTSTSIEGWESASSVSDASGNLLFYTNGIHVWDRNHNQMPNASYSNPLHPYAAVSQWPAWEVTSSTTQGALIVENIGKPDKYYLFSLTEYEARQPLIGCLFYSIVDMKLRGGLGDVATGKKWMPIDTALTEKMIAVPGDSCDIWVLVHSRDSNVFKAYRITSAGLDPNPVLSHSGVSGTAQAAGYPPVNAFWMVGQMSISPDRKKLAITNGVGSFTELHDFDPATGVVSNSIIVDTTGFGNFSGYGVAFSSDGTKLYVSDIRSQLNNFILNDLYQFDITVPTRAAIAASKILVHARSGAAGLRLAPDEKIYFLNGSGIAKKVSVINSPNLQGTACDPVANVFSQPYRFPTLEWTCGNDYVKTLPGSIMERKRDTAICSLMTDIQLKAIDAKGINHLWSNGTTDTVLTISERGKYWVSYKIGCDRFVDTFVILGKDSPEATVNLGTDTVLCGQPYPYLLDATISVGDVGYRWQNGDTKSTYTVNETGSYWVELNENGCVVSDTIHVSYFDLQASLGSDKVVCDQPQETLLKVDVPQEAIINWSTGNTEPTLRVSNNGDYWVTVSMANCTAKDTVNVRFTSCNCRVALPDAFTPNGDGNNDKFRGIKPVNCTLKDYSLQLYNRWGQKVFETQDVTIGWDGNHKGEPADMGIYGYQISYTIMDTGVKTFSKGNVTLIR